ALSDPGPRLRVTVEVGGPDGAQLAGSEPHSDPEPVPAAAAGDAARSHPAPAPVPAAAAGDAARSHASAGVAPVRPRHGPERHPVPEPRAGSEPGPEPAGLIPDPVRGVPGCVTVSACPD